MVGKEKLELLKERLGRLKITEEDLVETFILGSGKGGQKINKTASCVYLKHLPSGIEVKCQKERSRELNRYYARKMLCEKLETIEQGIKSEQKQMKEKIRRQKRRRSRRAQQKMLIEKRAHSEKKQRRSSPDQD